MHFTRRSPGAMLMSHSTESESSSLLNVDQIEQAIRTLKKSVSSHLECETRLERLCVGWQKKWLSQCEQLRIRIDSLEAQLAPWIAQPADGPRLAVVSRHEEVA